MKSIATLLLFTFISIASFAQSESFMTLKRKFSGSGNVFSFSTSGFVTRTLIRLSGDDAIIDATKNIRKVSLIVIPKEAFAKQDVSVNGFRKILKNDDFEEMITVKEHAENVTIYQQSNGNIKRNRYMFLVDEKEEVVAIEVTGHIDPNELLKDSRINNYTHL